MGQTVEPAYSSVPVTDDEMRLTNMLLERVNDLYPDWKFGDRTDLAMSMFAVVKQWAHTSEAELTKGESYEIPSGRIIRLHSTNELTVDEHTEDG